MNQSNKIEKINEIVCPSKKTNLYAYLTYGISVFGMALTIFNLGISILESRMSDGTQQLTTEDINNQIPDKPDPKAEANVIKSRKILIDGQIKAKEAYTANVTTFHSMAELAFESVVRSFIWIVIFIFAIHFYIHKVILPRVKRQSLILDKTLTGQFYIDIVKPSHHQLIYNGSLRSSYEALREMISNNSPWEIRKYKLVVKPLADIPNLKSYSINEMIDIMGLYISTPEA